MVSTKEMFGREDAELCPNEMIATLLKKYTISEINSAIRNAKAQELVFTLNEPRKITVCQGKTYKKEPLIGGESFYLTGAYLENSGDIIFVFDIPDVRKGLSAEIKCEEAIVALSGFFLFVETILNDPLFGAEMTGQSNVKKENNIAKKTNEKYKNTEAFGSW